MRISVVMSTYNGEKYVTEQLDSIRLQTRKADEVVISDDCSKDTTIEVVQEYINRYGLSTWRFIKNNENKGFVRNFLDGAENATGELIFFSDQDDIWSDTKIEHMEDALKEKNALAVYCLMDTIGADGKQTTNQTYNMNKIKTKSRIQKISLCEKVKYGRSPGLCLAFKKELLKEVRTMALEYGLSHDLPVGTVAAVRGGYYALNETLVHHRIHGNNASSPETSLLGSISSLKKQIDSRDLRLRELRAIRDIYGETCLTASENRILRKAIEKTERILNELRENNALGLLKSVFSGNRMMDRRLTVRNFLAVIYERSHK